MDVSKLIGKTERLVLPWFGGARVTTDGRALRVAAPAPERPGFHLFEVRGRTARAIEPADPPDFSSGPLERLPVVRGHFTAGWLASSGRDLEPLGIAPSDEPAELALLRTRRWFSGEIVVESVDFETEAEEAARAALFDGRSLEGVRGVVPSLRVAFGIATYFRAARAEATTIDVGEIRATALLAADGGVEAARADLRRRAQARAEAVARAEEARRERVQAAEWEAIQGSRERALRAVWIPEADAAPARGGRGPGGRARGGARDMSFPDRVEAVLREADSEMMSVRNLDAGLVEVGWRHAGQTFFTIVRNPTMQVVDAGFCLDGADEETNLASLPGVAREAMADGVLHVTRR